MDDGSAVKIMQSLGLDYKPAENSIKSFESRIASLNKQLFNMKADAAKYAKDINQTFASQLGSLGGNKTILDQFGQPLKTIQAESKKAGSSIGNMASAYTNTGAAAKKYGETIKDVAKKTNIFADQWQRKSSWFMSGALFYGGINAGKEAVQTISEVEMGVTEIARVMEDSSFVFKDYRDELLQLGVDYGNTFENVQGIALRWAQAGYNVKDSLENTKTSLLALNTAELDASSATESMIGIMAQWQMISADLPLMLDKINKTADDFTVTSQDLVDGLLRSSSAAKIMGLSIDQTISLLTVMREASGRTGREVGNALNSILSYVQRPGSIKMFESMGIQVFADAAKTQFRNVMDTFQDVASRWGTLAPEIQDGFVQAADDAGLFNEELAAAIGTQQEWNDLQQRDLSQAAAGVYRRNYFIGMIERLSGAQKVLNGMTDAAGYSQAENARTMDTLAKKYESLKTAAQELAVALGDAGLLDILKGLTDGAKNAADGFAKMNPEMKTLVITALELLAAAKAIKAVGGLFGVEATLGAASKAIPKWLGAATAVAPGWAKLIPLIIAAAGALGLYVFNSKAAADGLSEEGKILGSLGEKYIQQKEKLSSLKQGTDEYNAAQSEMQKIMSDIAQNSPELITALDDHANITGIDEEAIQKLADAYGSLKEAQEKHIQSLQNLTDEQLRLDKERLESTVSTLESQLISEQSALEYYQNRAPGYIANKKEATNWLESIGNFFYQNGFFGTGIGATEGWGETPAESLKDDMSQTMKDLEAAKSKFKSIMDEYNKRSKAKEEADGDSDDNGDDNSGDDNSDDNIILNNYIKQLEFKKNLDQLSIQDEISGYQYALDYLAQTEDEKMDLRVKLHNTEKQLIQETTQAYEELYQNQLAMIDRKVKRGEWSTSQELNELQWTLKAFTFTAEQKEEILDRIYDKEKQLQDERLNNSTEWISEQKALGLLPLQDEIAGYNRMLANQGNNPEAVKAANKGIYDAQKELMQLTFQNSKNWIDEMKDFDNLSIKDEIAAWERVKKYQSNNVEAVKEATRNIYNLQKQLADDALQNSKDNIDETKSYGLLSLEEEIEAYNKILAEQSDNSDAVKYANKGLFDAYKEQLGDLQDTIKDYYDEQIKKIDEKAKKDKQAQQGIIDGIEEEEKALDRKEQKYDYENKKADLQKDLAYWSVRTSEEARKKVVDINEQIAEEEHGRDIELKKQGFEDDKQAAQDKIDNIEETAETEKEKWKAVYEDIEKAFDTHNVNIIANARLASQQTYDEWYNNYIVPMQNALIAADTDAAKLAASKIIPSISGVGGLQSSISKTTPTSNNNNTQASNDSSTIHDWGMSDAEYKTFVRNGNEWWKLENAGYKDVASLALKKQLQDENDAIRRKYNRDTDLGEYPQFHTGAKTLSYGMAMFKPGELVFPPDLSTKMEGLLNFLKGSSTYQTHSSYSQTDNRKETKIEKLLNVENMNLGDDVDSDILARQISRAVMSIR